MVGKVESSGLASANRRRLLTCGSLLLLSLTALAVGYFQVDPSAAGKVVLQSHITLSSQLSKDTLSPPSRHYEKGQLVKTEDFNNEKTNQLVEPHCSAFANKSLRSVAVVGNGPLSEAQRKIINEHDLIIRFNELNNMRKEERIDVWVTRYRFTQSGYFWGFQELPNDTIEAVINKSESIWLVANSAQRDASQDLVVTYPHLLQRHVAYLDQDSLWQPREEVAEKGYVKPFQNSPSSGMIGLLATLSCLRPGLVPTIFGMNWNSAIWEGHDAIAEAAVVKILEKLGIVQVAKTPCVKLRDCSTAPVGPVSCEYDEQNTLVCLQKMVNTSRPTLFVPKKALRRMQRDPEVLKVLLKKYGSISSLPVSKPET